MEAIKPVSTMRTPSGGSNPASPSRRKPPLVLRLLSLLCFAAGFVIVATPLVLRAMSQAEQTAAVAAAQNTVDGWPYPQAEEALAAARAYNEQLAAGGQDVIGEVVDPFGSTSGASTATGAKDSIASQDTTYQGLLDAGSGLMCSVRIPKIDVNLPVYHGASNEVLAAGAGHLYGTSLPVGGESTHAVLTGHRGVPGSLLFTRLDELRVGDSFYIEVMGEELGYKIDRIDVIEPDDDSKLRVTAGEDRVTLMTCTPYGVNSHRLLVSGVRANIPDEVPVPEEAQGINTTAVALGVLGALLAIVVGLVVAGHVRKKRRAARGAACGRCRRGDAGRRRGCWRWRKRVDRGSLQACGLLRLLCFSLLGFPRFRCCFSRVSRATPALAPALVLNIARSVAPSLASWSFARTAARSRTCRTTRWSSFPRISARTAPRSSRATTSRCSSRAS